MAEDEDSRRESRRAQLLAAMSPQTGPAQEQMRQQQQQSQQMRDLSQVTITRRVQEAPMNAQQTFVAFVGGAVRIKPDLESEMRREDSQLLRILKMEEGRA